MTRVYHQLDANADHVNVGCSGQAQASTPQSCNMQEQGTFGSSAETVTLAAEAVTDAGYMMESVAGEPGITDWSPGGDWTCRINISSGDSSVTLEEVYVCRVNSSGVSQETLGSATGLGLSTTGSQPISVSVTCSATTASTSDRIYVVWVFSNSQMHNTRSIDVVPDVMIDATIAGTRAWEAGGRALNQPQRGQGRELWRPMT